MSDKPYIAGLAYVPLAMLSGVDQIKRKLTVKPRSWNGQPTRPIHCYDESVEGYLGMPVSYAINFYDFMAFEDCTSFGEKCFHRRLPDPNHPAAAEGQAQFMEDMYEASKDYFTVFAKAETGTGKTVVALDTAARRARRTLIIVTSVDLGRQWKTAIKTHLGLEDSEIGWVQGAKCDFEKPFNIAIAHSIAGRAYSPAFYQSMGTVIYDELHRFGAELFSQTCGLFPAQCTIGLSAHSKRGDGCEKVFIHHFGEPTVVAKSKAAPCRVNVIKYDCTVSRYKQASASIIDSLIKDDDRNRLCAKIIKSMYDRDRQTLVVSDRTHQLQHMMVLLNAAGVPYSDMGLYVNRRYTGETRSKLNKKTGKTEVVLVTKPVSVSDLEYIKKNSRIVLGTYGMLEEGKDIPRLNAGIDITPRAKGLQAIGRIRRPEGGADTRVWYTIQDVGHDVLERFFKARVKEYGVAGAEVIHHGYIR